MDSGACCAFGLSSLLTRTEIANMLVDMLTVVVNRSWLLQSVRTRADIMFYIEV